MSVDAGHRRRFCDLINKFFNDKQFIITTHDKVWANQLRTAGVVSSGNSFIEFYNWDINLGPRVNFDPNLWTKLDAALSKGDIPSAAARLRRASEEFFGNACNNLNAEVVYRQDGRWDLGDFISSAMSQYKKLLKKAKDVAQSYGEKGKCEELKQLDEARSEAFKCSQAEQWPINQNVHFSNWANFEEPDFRPVVEAFKELFALFECEECGSMLWVEGSAKTHSSVRCQCGKIFWNLIKQ